MKGLVGTCTCPLVGAFNQEKAPVEAFSMIVKSLFNLRFKLYFLGASSSSSQSSSQSSSLLNVVANPNGISNGKLSAHVLYVM